MGKIFIKSQFIRLDNIQYKINFFQTTKLADQISYSSEIVFDIDSCDKIILDDEDLDRLQNKTCLIIPVAHQSRAIAKMKRMRNCQGDDNG